MNRKQVLGRASLSFPTEEGLLDIDQILETESWSQIDDFVQKNFMQNILNEFNKRMTIDPKHTPTDSKSLAKKRPTSSSRTARKCQTGRTAREKLTEEKNDPRGSDAASPKEHKKEVANKSESSTKRQTKKKRILRGKENKEKPITEGVEGKQKEKGKPKGETHKAKKLPVNRQKRNASTLPVKKQAIATPLNNCTEKIANASFEETENVVTKEKEIKREPKVEDSMPYVNASKKENSTSPFETSTPKREKSQISNSLGKEVVIARHNAVAPERGASIIKQCEKDLNNNCPEIIATKKENKKTAAECEHEAVASGKRKKQKEPESNVASGAARSGKRTKTSKCAKGDSRKMATTAENKKIGKFERRLLETQDRRGKKKILRHERKAERAMEKFSHHVMRIAKQMGYLPDDSSGDSSDNDCCCNSSEETSYSDSCCSNSTCSCCSSCSSYSFQYSEYTLDSSSD